MSLSRLQITGLRGFATTGQIDFAIPNGKEGSGITVLVGPNNGGKSTVVESLRVLSRRTTQSFTVGDETEKLETKYN
jgi:predicted ATP-dependent endonuclease of OLD family